MSRITIAFGGALLLVEIVVTAALVGSDIRDGGSGTALALGLFLASMFVISGLVALARRPENHTGLYLAAVGYLGLFSGLTLSANDWLFTIGFAFAELVWVPFAALVLAFPTGQLEGRLERLAPVLTATTLPVAAILMLLFDRTPPPLRCDDCPESQIVIANRPGLAEAMYVVSTVVGLGLIVLVLTLVVRRWRKASPALRRLLWPVLAAASAALATIGAAIIADQVSDVAGRAVSLLLVVSLASVPLAFLAGILRSRLARASVTQLVVGLQEGTPLAQALGNALGDPSVEIAYHLDPASGIGGPGWVDAEGRPVPEPAPAPGRAVQRIEQSGRQVAAVTYDVSLCEEPELVEAVTAAAGLALSNERLQAELRAQARLAGALAETAPSLLSNVDTDGRMLKVNAATVEASGYAHEDELRGRFFWDVFIDPEEREAMVGRFKAAAPDFAANEYENTFTNARGERLVIYWRSAPVLDEERRVVSIVAGGLDVTERKRREEEAERRRSFLDAITDAIPSFLVAVDPNGIVMEDGVNPAFSQTFGWTKEEISGRSFLELISDQDQYEGHMAIANAANGVLQGERESWWVGRDGTARAVAWTARPVLDVRGRDMVLVSGSDVTVRRRQEEELRASRARLVEAADDARRKLERNLHDGAQQRLVALSVSLRLAESKLQSDPPAAGGVLAAAREELAQALAELRELARGIHPAVLTDRGLSAAVDALVARSPVPVEAEVPEATMPPAVEAAAYYVVAEALTNVVKYGQASAAEVSVKADNGTVTVTVSDDGVGGADPAQGSGLRGLADRVEALEGHLVVTSPRGRGTTVRAEIPIDSAPS
ncbi:MAG: PAS domain-containing sensor histidine kinase [Gaiellaceae bacterium]